ncbi:MAG TPA: acyl-CoA reductase, partial [Flavobacteriales bacterium]|nr:acyl-CoA reductase [Flavobacteriales bacterium]
FPWSAIANNNKYANNYDYTRAIWLLDKVEFLDNGFLLLKEDEAITSPVGTVFYERYSDRADVEKKIAENADRIQCVVGKKHLSFGATQQPGLSDYADGVDTMKFLLEL